MERRHLAALLRIHKHAFHLEVLAAAEQFGGGPAGIPQEAHRLARFRHGFEVRDGQSFFKVKRAFIPVPVGAVVVVQAVGEVGALLDFGDEAARADGVNRAGRDNLISGSSAFSKTSLNIWKFPVHVLLKPGLENFPGGALNATPRSLPSLERKIRSRTHA